MTEITIYKSYQGLLIIGGKGGMSYSEILHSNFPYSTADKYTNYELKKERIASLFLYNLLDLYIILL